jgi:carbonic anhydrase/acetyltransferase-like protein (isoleucine patch superfamily)
MLATEFRPQQVHPTVFIAQGAVVVGDVTLEEGCSVWFNATLRADTTPVHIKAGTNIQEAWGENCIVGANSLLTQGKVFPPGSLIIGSPAKVIRELTPEEIEANRETARRYAERARIFKGG